MSDCVHRFDTRYRMAKDKCHWCGLPRSDVGKEEKKKRFKDYINKPKPHHRYIRPAPTGTGTCM